jgi:short-subunit dehydrogenase
MLENKVVVLTGATGGIGREVAKLLAARNATMILVDVDLSWLQASSREIGATNEKQLTIIKSDLAAAGDRDILCTYIYDNYPQVDVLINCAGINEFGLFSNLDEESIEKMININVTSPMVLTRKLLPLLEKSEQGQIINFGSTFGSIGYPGFVTYSATKFAMRGFSEALRRELAKTRITVGYIAPRATKTSINSGPVYEMNAALGVKMDEPASVARAVLAMIKDGRSANNYLGWPEKLFVRINNLLPGLVDGSLRKQLDTIIRFAGASQKHDPAPMEKSS